METSYEERAEAVCTACGGRCCREAHPPVCQERRELLRSEGIGDEHVEHMHYTRLRVRDDGMCVLFLGGKCRIHAFKPETCVAGPFTFDVTDHSLRIFLKRESVCPLVALFKEDRDAYAAQFRKAVEQMVLLVRGLPAPELQVISSIPEPDTDLVAEIPLSH